MLGVSQITNPKWIVTAASRSFEASWSKSVQKILNELKIFSSNDNKQLVNGAPLRSWIVGAGTLISSRNSHCPILGSQREAWVTLALEAVASWKRHLSLGLGQHGPKFGAKLFDFQGI